MRALTIILTFCLLQALMCVSLEVTEESLKKAVVESVPFLKVFHQESLKIDSKENLSNLVLKYPVLNPGNIQFKFDDFGLLHIKYVNLKLTLTGKNKARVYAFSVSSDFGAELTNFSWEQVYAVKVNDLGNGKVDLKKTKTSEAELNYNINKLTMQKFNQKYNIKEIETVIKNQIKLLNLKPLKAHLRWITELFFVTLQSDLNNKVLKLLRIELSFIKIIKFIYF